MSERFSVLFQMRVETVSDFSSQKSWAQSSGLTAKNHNGTEKNRWKKRQSKTTPKHVEFCFKWITLKATTALFLLQKLSLARHTWKTKVFQSVWKLAQRLIESLMVSSVLLEVFADCQMLSYSMTDALYFIYYFIICIFYSFLFTCWITDAQPFVIVLFYLSWWVIDWLMLNIFYHFVIL